MGVGTSYVASHFQLAHSVVSFSVQNEWASRNIFMEYAKKRKTLSESGRNDVFWMLRVDFDEKILSKYRMNVRCFFLL